MCYNNMSFDQWNKANQEEWRKVVNGETILTLPDKFYFFRPDFDGIFIQIQPNCLIDEPPGVFVRETFYKAALKVLLPSCAKAGDQIRMVKKAASGKSLIGEIV